MDGALPADQPDDWPPEDEIRAYNAEARARLDRMLPEVASPFLHVAIEHRLMHAETLAYLLHQVPLLDKKDCPPPEKIVTGPTHAPRMADIPAGTATIGQPRRDDVFGAGTMSSKKSARLCLRFRAQTCVPRDECGVPAVC